MNISAFKKKHRLFLILISGGLFISTAFAENRNVNLVVAYKAVHFAGKWRRAIAVNNQIPAPTLHFKKGDHVSIHVYNHLDKGTAIHWHGILLPWQMDGVEGVTQKPIPPSGVFHYRFTLYQSGTYWYHAHKDLQEQEGLYGAFIVDPPRPPAYHYHKNYVVVLSDWSNTSANQVLRNLKKEGDYYSPKFPLQASLMKFIRDYRKATPAERKKIKADYKMMQDMRMSIYDFSDVAYDAYLLNGQTKMHPWTAQVRPGDVVRLRFIGAAGSTIYRIKIPGATMRMVQVEGNDIKPYTLKNFTLAPGETYDVLVKIQKNAPTIIYAESIDTLGKAYGALITKPHQRVDYQKIRPFPEPEPVTREMMENRMPPTMNPGARASSHASMHMNHDMNMSMPNEASLIGDTISPAEANHARTSGTKYQNLIAAVKTNNPNIPLEGIIRMELFGYMDRYIWFINGLPEYKAKPILIAPGKRYRIIFTNNSMMRHPMHIHGHWFILRNGHGAYDPLLHTIEVPPGATAVADFDTDASGQWFFHCHHLYHMMTGMSRLFRYTTLIDVVRGLAKPENEISAGTYYNQPIIRKDETMPIDPSLIHHPMAHGAHFYFANLLDMGANPVTNIEKISFEGLYGGDYNKIQLYTKDAEINQGRIENADMDFFYWHMISQFWAIKGGANYFYRPAQNPYWQAGMGIEGLMPYFIDTDLRTYYHRGNITWDLELSRDTHITRNFFLRLGIRSIFATETIRADEIGSGLNQMRYIVRPYYRLGPGLNIFAEFEYERDYGQLKHIRHEAGESTSESSLTFGLAALF